MRDGVITTPVGVEIPARPMIGTIGVAPATSSPTPLLVPTAAGGNMDISQLVAGSTLHLPAQVPGGLLSAGDTHAAQGDGEVCGTGAETPATVRLRVSVASAVRSSAPWYEHSVQRQETDWTCTTGIGPDLFLAARDANRRAVDLIAARTGLEPVDALSVAEPHGRTPGIRDSRCTELGREHARPNALHGGVSDERRGIEGLASSCRHTSTIPPPKGAFMQAITVRDRAAGVGGLSLTDIPYPHAAQNDVIVRVHAAGFTPGELDWSSTWVDRAGRDRTPSVPGHELSGVVAELGYGTTGLTVGQRVFGLLDWTRNGSLAEYAAVEARNLAPLPAGIDHTVAAALPISGLTAWQGLMDHARLTTGQTVLIHGAAGGVGSIAVQLAREVGAVVIGTGRARTATRPSAWDWTPSWTCEADRLEDAGEVDVVLDVIGGEILDRSAALVRAGGTLVTTIRVPTVQPKDGRAVFFVVEADRSRLADLAHRLRDGRLKPIVGAVRPLAEAPAAFAPDRRTPGKTIIRITEGGRCPGGSIAGGIFSVVGYLTDGEPEVWCYLVEDASLFGWPSPPATPRRRDA